MSELETVEKRIQKTVKNLSLENIEECLERIHNLQINSKSSFKTLVDVLHEKATTKPSSTAVYAQLCKRLVTVFDAGGTQIDFQKLLLNKSWKELEQGTQEALGTEDEDGKKISSKLVGNVRFIKELFKLGVLIEPFMLECINQLFKQRDDESLKCLQRLKNTIREKEKAARAVEKAFHSSLHFVDNQGVKSSKPTEVVSSLLTQKVKLQESENAQKTTQKMASSLSADIKELECDVRMQLNDIMKKLSLENFEVLEEIQSLHKGAEQAFILSVHLILEKVTNEEASAFISAHLCKHLIYENDGTSTSKPSFQEILLNKCRDELKLDKHFGKEHEDSLKVTHFDKKDEETENKEEKGTSLRHIRIFWFIIELFKLGVLTEPIILQYIDKLFTEGSEESLNCLFRLRTIIDRNLDEITASKKFGKKPEYVTLHKRLYEIYWNLSPNNTLEHFEIIQSFHTESSFNLLVDVLRKRAEQETPSSSQWAELSRCLGKRKEFEQKNDEQKITLRQIKNLRCFIGISEMSMLTEHIILLCIDKLFIQGSNESLKCLFRLWKKIDRKLDENTIVKIAEEVTAKNWIPVKSENSPNTIDQTHREAEREACEQQPLYQNIKLHESENAWKPLHKIKIPSDANLEELEKDNIRRSVQSVLNKLTLQNFETLLVQMKNLNIDTEKKLSSVTELLYENSIYSLKHQVPYAKLYKHLCLIKVPVTGTTGTQVNLRKLFLKRCQREFEQMGCDKLKKKERMKALDEADPDKKKELKRAYDKEETTIRFRHLGNTGLIGELFKLGMLIKPIVHDCIKELLRQGDDMSLECLCVLLKTIGKELDAGEAANYSRDNQMDTCFDKMKIIVEKRLTSSRVRFMLQDLIDLKKNNWVPRNENSSKTTDMANFSGLSDCCKEGEKNARRF